MSDKSKPDLADEQKRMRQEAGQAEAVRALRQIWTNKKKWDKWTLYIQFNALRLYWHERTTGKLPDVDQWPVIVPPFDPRNITGKKDEEKVEVSDESVMLKLLTGGANGTTNQSGNATNG